MSDKEFVRLVEFNDHEGENWSFFLQTTGNEKELETLKEAVSEINDEEGDEVFLLFDNRYPEAIVDIIVKEATSGYHNSDNKVAGKLVLPSDFSDMEAEDKYELLYKGGIKDLFVKE